MTPQAKKLLRHLETAGSITAREALLDLDMTSATLARRICDLEKAGHCIFRESRVNPATGKRYTHYTLGSSLSPVRALLGPLSESHGVPQ